jgi:hypothetical protein
MAYAHDAVVAMQPGSAPNAAGGAITLALCGSWAHPPPCPLAPHYVTNSSAGTTVTLRVLFATEVHNEPRVRALIREALALGRSQTPGGGIARWRMRSESTGEVHVNEDDHAAHLIAH